MTRNETPNESNRQTQTMKDVSHTPPTGDSVTNVWERGWEHDADDDDRGRPVAKR